MSIAYQALVLIVYILPGILFRRRMSTAGHFRQQRSLPDELAQSMFWALCGHALWIYLASWTSFSKVNLEAAIMHAMGQYGPNSSHFDDAVKAVSDHFDEVLFYFGSLYVFAIFAGSLVGYFRGKHSKWLKFLDWIEDHEPADQRYREWLRFVGDPPESIEYYRLLATVIDLGKTAYLYVGKLEDCHFGPDGNPERFLLSGVMRRPLGKPEYDPQELRNLDGFHEIEGDRFIIRAAEAKTFNILIWELEQESSADMGEDAAVGIDAAP